jgi:hypothetical protein
MIRIFGALVAILLKRNEGTDGRCVDDGKRAVGHHRRSYLPERAEPGGPVPIAVTWSRHLDVGTQTDPRRVPNDLFVTCALPFR